MPKTQKARFDRDYYARYYENPKTRVSDSAQIAKLVRFVAGYLGYLGVPVRGVLDIGCGLGLWREPLAQAFPGARYVGVEVSQHLCERLGWKHGSVVDYRAARPFDLVICQGVLPYLSAKQARAAMGNLAELCRGALYLEAVTKEDFEEGVVDEKRTDASMQRHSRAFYRRGLDPHFVAAGGGVFLARSANVPVYALERV
jgi:2-polyprenyl-3-methyl-5-hydroxy-6-metoxy-1,4-benzoquinol methylase